MNRPRLGAIPLDGGRCEFRVWAPAHARMQLRLVGQDRGEPLERDEFGYHAAIVESAPTGSRYVYRMPDGFEAPDPASRSQPDGVHGASEVVDSAFDWSDQGWRGLQLSAYVLYELHVGTFTSEGTFGALEAHLGQLRDLGVTAIELMPVAQFPGSRNWGYDGVYPFAVQTSYGGPRGLQRLIDSCHRYDLAVALDVVYNHLGPEGNFLERYGPYFTEVYRTPWGSAINFDGPGSDCVRDYFIQNALEWIRDFHVDGLRLDAVHAILDRSAKPFLEELAVEVHALARKLGRNVVLMAESDLNDPRLIADPAHGGYGLDSMWSDDMHHAAHALLTGEQSGYYVDFGRLDHLTRAWNRGMTYTGEYSAFRKRRHGRRIEHLDTNRLVVCVQNHDQVGNRMFGERLGALVDHESEKLAAAIAILSPFIPLLFMGQEYGELAPFQYFVSHGEPALVEAVRKGRCEEFRSFGWTGDIPDPQSEDTFRRCVLDHRLRTQGRHAVLENFHRRLLALRARLATERADEAQAFEEQHVLLVRRGDRAWMLLHFGSEPRLWRVPASSGRWVKVLDSALEAWRGPGSRLPQTVELEGAAELTLAPRSIAVYEAEGWAAPELAVS